MITVVVADDHAVVRRGVLQILQEAPDVVVIGEASTGQEALELVQKQPCDVLILDISMPGWGGFEVLERLRNVQANLHVLILSMYPEREYAIRALKSGAAGYLTKESAPDELVAAVRKAAQGHRYVTTSLAERLATVLLDGSREQEPHEILSEREYQVMCHLARGEIVSKIALEL
ncbi:MAG: response regulator transcription factor, partial [Chloroflexi bacterium]|nr:response regulator transcription factor [Chloroflexota bacterium]